MQNHAWRSASPGLSSSDDDTDSFGNGQTGANNATRSRLVHSHVTLEILQAHLDADAESDSSEASGPRVHPDFFVHLENLRRVNEANRANARREAEAWYHDFLIHQALHEFTIDANNQSSQVANQFNQPSYHAGTEHGLQPSAMGMPEQYEIQNSTAAGPSQPRPPHVRFETPHSTGHVSTRGHSYHHRPPSPYPTANPASHVHTRDRSHHHRPPSPYPTAGQGQRSTLRNYVPTIFTRYHLPYHTEDQGQRSTFRNYGPTAFTRYHATTTSTPQPQEYTEHGNPYAVPPEPALLPEDAIPYDPERLLQAWLIRQQLIAGIRPEDIQPMGQRNGARHRTPPHTVLNESGAHILRIENARFEGVMLPLPALPWLPQRPNNSRTAPASSNTQDGRGLPTGPSIMTAPDSANTLNSPVGPHLPVAATNSPVGHHLPAAATNSPVGHHLPAAVTNSPVGHHLLAAATNSPVGPHLPAAATNSPVGSHLPAAVMNSPVGSHLQAVSDPTSVPEQISEVLNEHVAESETDSHMAAFFQHLRLHEDANSVSVSMPGLLPGPSRTEPGSSDNSRAPVVTPQSQGRGFPTPSPSSSEGSEAGYVSSP